VGCLTAIRGTVIHPASLEIVLGWTSYRRGISARVISAQARIRQCEAFYITKREIVDRLTL
jgi:hypothetical protein